MTTRTIHFAADVWEQITDHFYEQDALETRIMQAIDNAPDEERVAVEIHTPEELAALNHAVTQLGIDVEEGDPSEVQVI